MPVPRLRPTRPRLHQLSLPRRGADGCSAAGFAQPDLHGAARRRSSDRDCQRAIRELPRPDHGRPGALGGGQPGHNSGGLTVGEHTPARIEVLVPNWNRSEFLPALIESLRAQSLPHGVCVIDNGSTDGSAELVRRRYPEVRLVTLPSNLGFGAAINAGARSSEAELIVLLNNDTVADDGFLEGIDSARRHTGAEMIAACLRRPDGSIDTLGVVLDQSLVPYELAHGEPYEEAKSSRPAPFSPCGGAGCFEREAFLGVGGFDEALFAYLEDAELGIRMRLAGMTCAAAYDAFAWHEHAGTLGAGTVAKNRLIAEGRGYLLWKYGASLSRSQRARGLLLDGVVYAGQAVTDRNLGAIRGRIASRSMRRAGSRPSPVPGLRSLPLARLGLLESICLKLSRRRWRSALG